MTTAAPDALAEGRFRLLEVLGQGGMATVYRAFDVRLQRPRAVKILAPTFASRPQLRRRFLTEAQTMATLEESRVVRVFDMGEDGDRVFIVMELVEGGSLLDRVQDFGPLPPRMAADVVIQVCESLQAAHDAGVIHRDIKPHNILLTRTGEIRISDFGIAQVQHEGSDGMTRTGAVMGTWGFMAPEQKSNAKTVDARADIYSVGATLWALLKSDTPPELFVAEKEPEMLDGIPEELAAVILTATRYRREERYPSATAMADSVRGLLALLPPDPEMTPPLVPPGGETRRRPLDTLDQFSELASAVLPPPPAAHHTAVGTAIPPLGTIAPDDPSIPALDDAPRGYGKAFAAALVIFALAVGGTGWYLFTRPEPVVDPVPVAIPDPPVVTPPLVDPPVVDPPVVTPDPPVATPDPTVVTNLPPVVAPDPPERIVPDPVPVEPPVLTHTPPAAAVVGDTVAFSASIQGKWTLKLYYRATGTRAFSEKPMAGSGGNYSASVTMAAPMTKGFEYFIVATNTKDEKLAEGAATRPLKLTVLAAAPPEPTPEAPPG